MNRNTQSGEGRASELQRIANRFELEHLSTGGGGDNFKLESGRAIAHDTPENSIYRIGITNIYWGGNCHAIGFLEY
jgi:hypothetical protein